MSSPIFVTVLWCTSVFSSDIDLILNSFSEKVINLIGCRNTKLWFLRFLSFLFSASL